MNNPGLPFWLSQWNWAPSLIIGLIVVVGAYLYVIWPLRLKYKLGPEVPRWRVICFLIGALLIFLALVSPLDAIGDDYLFSGHMVQHMVLSLFGPPLIFLGLVDWMLKPLLRPRLVLRVGKWITNPFFVGILFNANLWLWHAPPLYNAALQNDQLHIFMHLCYIGTGLLFWWPVVSPMQEEMAALPLVGKLIYIFFSDMPMVLLGAGLTFTPPLYQHYINAPRVFGISAAVDQQLGGSVMWIVGSIFLIVLVSIFFIRWMQQLERNDQQQAAIWLAEDEMREDEEEDEESQVRSSIRTQGA